MTWQRTRAALVFLITSAGCGGEDAEPLSPDLAALREAFARHHAEATEDSEGRLESTLATVLAGSDAPCAGCEMRLDATAGPGRGRVVVDILEAAEPLARLHLFYRPELETGRLGEWAPDRIGDHAADIREEQSVVWPGRVEIRLFSRRTGLGPEVLRDLAAALPLDDLARL